MPLEQQLAIARGQAREAALLYASPQPLTATAIELAAPARSQSASCAIYAQQVRDLDAEALRPLPALRQDQIWVDRMNVMTTRACER